MAGSSQTFSEKVNLIYEYNKQSPLFVRVANNEIEKNNFERALEILNEGIIDYPNYPVAHIMLGKTLNLLGKYKEALDAFRKGSELINSNKVYEYYRREVESLKKQRIFLETNKSGSAIENDNVIRAGKNISLEEELSSFDSLEGQRTNSISLKTGSDSIVSETLANIYVNQGEFREAIKILEKLLNKNPQKKDYYLQKINDIKAKLE
ncbi:MAG TPA: tetratricopeptide repeat protein [Ignavibacteriaceae bacterium]|nr:tetratricopeptide repeat protein [Ignavibacteriaceae bacterium]